MFLFKTWLAFFNKWLAGLLYLLLYFILHLFLSQKVSNLENVNYSTSKNIPLNIMLFIQDNVKPGETRLDEHHWAFREELSTNVLVKTLFVRFELTPVNGYRNFVNTTHAAIWQTKAIYIPAAGSINFTIVSHQSRNIYYFLGAYCLVVPKEYALWQIFATIFCNHVVMAN